MSEFNELSEIIANKIVPPTGCWKDYNVHHRAWTAMNDLAKIRSFFLKSEHIPDEPNPQDYSNLDSDCES